MLKQLLDLIFKPKIILPLWMRCGAIQKCTLEYKNYDHIIFPDDKKI